MRGTSPELEGRAEQKKAHGTEFKRPAGILFFCPKTTTPPSSTIITMATSLAAGRAPKPRARPPRRPRHQAPPRGRAGTPFGGQPSWAPRGVASRGCETTSCFTRFHDVFSLALPTATGMASPPAAHAGGQNLAPAGTWLEPGWHTLAHTGTSWHTVAGTPHNMSPWRRRLRVPATGSELLDRGPRELTSGCLRHHADMRICLFQESPG